MEDYWMIFPGYDSLIVGFVSMKLPDLLGSLLWPCLFQLLADFESSILQNCQKLDSFQNPGNYGFYESYDFWIFQN